MDIKLLNKLFKLFKLLVAFQIGDFETNEPFDPIPTSILPLKGRKLIFLSLRERIKVRVGLRFNIRSPVFYATKSLITGDNQYV